MFKDLFVEYLQEAIFIYEHEDYNESNYRKAFHKLLEGMAVHFGGELNIHANPQEGDFCGDRPDFCIKYNEDILGYIETQNPKADYFREIETAPQIKKYLTISDNILATNYFSFKFLVQKDTGELDIKWIDFGNPLYLSMELVDGNLSHKFEDLRISFRAFFKKEINKINSPKILAKRLANASRILKDYLSEELLDQSNEELGQLYHMYNSFRNNLSEIMEAKEFVDAFSQMVSYALLLAKLNIKDHNEKLTLCNIREHIDVNFSLVSEMVKFLDVLTQKRSRISQKCGWIVEELLFIVNSLDIYGIAEHLSYNKKPLNQADPYLYFYEEFLQQYDKGLRVDRGVYYTPYEVVRYIVRSTAEILKNDLGIEDGFYNRQVKILDFATGTGTFLLEVYKEILDNLPSNSSKTKSIIKEVVLKNIYGFEYLIAPYVVAHLKLSEYLKSKNYIMDEQDRVQIYLTNTLSSLNPQADAFLPALSNEGEKAHKIKEEEVVVVIIGNPPYNINSKNPSSDKLGNLLLDYKPEGEQNIRSLGDDYIKFIRFAQDKLSQQKQGILSIVVNNSFINGLVHRKMRQELLKEFSSIYILNLHGDIRKKELTKDGEKDENIFKIMQGVCIAFFIKKEKQEEDLCKVYYQDLYGKRLEKLAILESTTIATTTWEILDIKGFNKNFNTTSWGSIKEESIKDTQYENIQKNLTQQIQDSLFNIEDLEKNNKFIGYSTRKRFKEDLSFFVPMSQEGIVEYGRGIGINEIFVEYKSGIESQKDKLAIHYSQESCINLVQEIKTKDEKTIRDKYKIEDGRDWKLAKAIKSAVHEEGSVEKIAYRPFDNRFTYYSSQLGVIARPRYSVMQHFLVKDNIGFCFTRQKNTIGEYNNFLATKNISCRDFITGKTYTTPLYITEVSEKKYSKEVSHSDYIQDRWIVKDNFSSYFKAFIKKQYDLDISYSGGGFYEQNNINKENIELVMGYIYGVMYSKVYKSKYLEYLKIDFPRIIFTEDIELFRKIGALGRKLMKSHLDNKLMKGLVNSKVEYSGMVGLVEKVKYKKEESRIYINKLEYFSGVNEKIYEYEIEGKVIEKYLKSRKGRVLSQEEIEHLENIMEVLEYTIKIEEELGILSQYL